MRISRNVFYVGVFCAMKPSKLQKHLETKHRGAVDQDIEYFKVSKQECFTIQSTITRTLYS